MPTITEIPDAREVHATTDIRIQKPDITDGAEMWRIARDSGSLDLNSSYAYMLYARDFRQTCRIVRAGDDPAGFVLANLRPERQDCLFVWQIAVDTAHRGLGLAGRMLDDLVTGLRTSHDGARADGIRTVETTITDDNTASQRLFHNFARRWSNDRISKTPLFEEEHFPDGHGAEPLYQIGPLEPAASV